MSKKSPSSSVRRVARKKAAQKGAGRRGRRAAGGPFEEQLRRAVAAVDVANSLTAPLKRSIENLLRLAAQSVGSDEASVLVRDGTRGGLKFMAAIGEVADKLLKVRLPPGKGIAGFVFASGQPVAIADVSQDDTFYPEVDRATGYSTQTVLATPLQVGGEIVGVLEFVNRLGEPPYKPFSPDEMDKAAHFADAIATLVDAHETAGLIETLFGRAVKSAAEAGASGAQADDIGELRRWLKGVRSAPEHRDLLSLALSLRDVASRGEAERKLCREILDALARWTDARHSSGVVCYLD